MDCRALFRLYHHHAGASLDLRASSNHTAAKETGLLCCLFQRVGMRHFPFQQGVEPDNIKHTSKVCLHLYVLGIVFLPADGSLGKEKGTKDICPCRFCLCHLFHTGASGHEVELVYRYDFLLGKPVYLSCDD